MPRMPRRLEEGRAYHVYNRFSRGEPIFEETVEVGRFLDLLSEVKQTDGFASGLIYGMLDGRELDEVVRLGWAHGALSTTFPGDVTMARLPEVETFAKGGSARVQR